MAASSSSSSSTNVHLALDESSSRSSSTSSSPIASMSVFEDGVGAFASQPAYSKLKLPQNATLAQLRETSRRCLEMIDDSNQCSDDRKWLVRYLVELRLRVQLLEDGDDGDAPRQLRVVTLGHHLELNENAAGAKKLLCDHCSGSVWTVVQEFYRCTDCHFVCHRRCVDHLIRVCSHTVVTETGSLQMAICPVIGLGAQRYKCAECKTRIIFDSRWNDPRLCDYTGLFYCSNCHWNNTCEIPARVIHNWDWEKRHVCRSSYQLLQYAKKLPLINVEQCNDKLFTLVAELGMVRRVRNDLKLMVRYLVECQSGSGLIQGDILHVAEMPKLYSMEYLELAKQGRLEQKLSALAETCRDHISKCQVCNGKGYLCELCGNDEIIFPFDASAVGCDECNSLFHRVCRTKKGQGCPKCVRMRKRKEDSAHDDDDDDSWDGM